MLCSSRRIMLVFQILPTPHVQLQMYSTNSNSHIIQPNLKDKNCLVPDFDELWLFAHNSCKQRNT